MRYTVVISTHNRALSLGDTLRSLAGLITRSPWEVIVVDNHSTDDTAAVVREAARTYPVELRYMYEPTEGKYAAMNTAIAASRGEIIAATDDDALVAPDWLERAAEALDRHQCEFVGGPVTPLWEGAVPPWLDLSKPAIQKVLALLDYGAAPREFGVGIGWPLGVNVAYRRDVFARAGMFDPSLGRKAGTLRSQAQREWHLRARAVGSHGFYAPDMRVQHRVGTGRLRKQYFRRWHYWHGISRARLYYKHGFDPEEPEQAKYARPLPSYFGVPRALLWKAFASIRSCVWRTLRGEQAQAFDYQLWLCFFAGLARESVRVRQMGFSGTGPANSPDPGGSAGTVTAEPGGDQRGSSAAQGGGSPDRPAPSVPAPAPGVPESSPPGELAVHGQS